MLGMLKIKKIIMVVVYNMWYLYILECIKMSRKHLGEIVFYTGITTDVVRRWHEHRGMYKSGWMSRNRVRPRRIVYVECLFTNDRYKAEKYERRVKRLSHKRKVELVERWRGCNSELVHVLDDLCRGGL